MNINHFLGFSLIFGIYSAIYSFVIAPHNDYPPLGNYPILNISIPKCGTGLLDKCTEAIVGTHNNFPKFAVEGIDLFTPQKAIFEKNTVFARNEHMISHFIYNHEHAYILGKKKFRIALIIRDPRDQIVSRAYYAKAHPEWYPGLQHLSIEQLISGYMGIGTLPNQHFEDLCTSHISYPNPPRYPAISHIVKFYRAFLPWAQCNFCRLVKFERLVGVAGGGNKKAQIDEIYQLGRHYGIAMTNQRAEEIANKLFGGTFTFREGKIGSWRKEFTQAHKEGFKKIPGANQMLIDLGYEKDANW